MAQVAFDTLKFSEKLIAAGFATPMAKALAEVQNESLSETLSMNIASKEDVYKIKEDIYKVRQELYAVKQDLKGDINAVRQELHLVKQELKEDIHELKADAKIKNWMFGFILTFLLTIFIKSFF